MKTWQSLLRDADPAADARLPDADRIRRALIVAAREPRPAPFRWQQPLAMAAILVLMIGSGIVAGRRAAERDAATSGAMTTVDGEREPAVERRQLQFSTPGGTRIIWVFNSQFDVKETTP